MVRDFCGHGLGRVFHDAPTILHYVEPSYDVPLKPGMFFTVEPMINLGRPHVKVLSDGWTAVTRDRSLSAQFEHTVGVTETGVRDLHPVAEGLDKPPYRTAVERRPYRPWRPGDERAGGTMRWAACKGRGPPHYLGHRDRLRARFLEVGGDALPDYELLELVLFRSIPRRDVKPLAKALIAALRHLRRGARRARARLKEVDGVGESVVTDLKIVEAAARRLAKGAVAKRPVLSSWSAVLDYCRAAMAFAEQGAVPHPLPRQAQRAHRRRGAADPAPSTTRRSIRARSCKRALELSASALILVHNHPSGDPTPSSADIEMTRDIIDIAKPLGITVHDHIIVGREGHASLKGLRLI